MYGAVLMLLLVAASKGSYEHVKIEDNGYSGVVVAIDSKVKEDSTLIDSIKALFTNASSGLHVATRKRTYFKNVTILVPKSWRSGTYDDAASESYINADVLIRSGNSQEDNTPFTLQYKGCGKPGQYIHMTPDFVHGSPNITNLYGPTGKVLVHEWAHLRWGVFDETNYNGNFQFYLDDGTVEANRCPKLLDGFPISVKNQTISNCDIDQNTFLPDESCFFITKETQPSNLTTSLMSYSYLAQVVTFCHNDTSDEINLHNKDAPNDQNLFCDRKSTWEVIMESPDFDQKNQPNPSVDTTPTFNVVRSQAERFVLILDVSGSMSGVRLQAMRQVTGAFIETFVAKGSYVGLVMFSSSAQILSQLQKINNQTIPELVALIPTVAEGGTGIGDGIRKGIDVLKSRVTEGSNMLVLTDGEENVVPYVSDVYHNVIENGVKMHTIFFDTQANNIMKNLSIESGGRWYFSQSSDPTAILEDFFAISQTSNEDVKTLLIHSDSVNIQPNVEFNDTVKIDKSVGENTVFSFSWNAIQAPLIRIWNSKKKCFYANYPDNSLLLCSDNSTYKMRNDTKTIRFNIAGRAEKGKWTFYIQSLYTDQVSSSVTSQSALNDEDPIVIEAWIEETNLVTKPALIYAKVWKGSQPVINATVTATTTGPNGFKETYKMKDNGKGSDIRADDGVYVKIFIAFQYEGRYSLKVTANGGMIYQTTGSKAQINFGTIDDDGNVSINKIPEKALQFTDDYQRIITGGGFEFSGNTTDDFIHPGKITDLRVEQVDLRNYTVGIVASFSASGDDAYDGTVSRYKLRYFVGNYADFSNNGGTLISDILQGNLTSPRESGNEERFVFLLNDADVNPLDKSIKVHVNVKSVDDEEQFSEASNIASMTYYLQADDLPKIQQLNPVVSTTLQSTTTTHVGESTTTTTATKTTAQQSSTFPDYTTIVSTTGLSTTKEESTIKDELSTIHDSTFTVFTPGKTKTSTLALELPKGSEVQGWNLYATLMWVFVGTTIALIFVMFGLLYLLRQMINKPTEFPKTFTTEINPYLT